MGCCVYLGEALGLGGIFLVAASAEVSHVWQFGHVRSGVIRVFGERPVAGLTVHGSMLTSAVHLGLLLVAEDTLIVACK